MIYFISGHRDLNIKNFREYYVPKIDRVLMSDDLARFVVGDYEGADIMAQEYLVSLGLSDKVTVYHMYNSPRHLASGITHLKGSYVSDDSRDSAMTDASDFDIAFLFKSGNSGTRQNILRRWNKKKKEEGS